MSQRSVVLGLVAAMLACSQSPPGGPADPAASETAPPTVTPSDEARGPARLRARPQREVAQRLRPGLQALGLGEGRDGFVYVPRDLAEPAPLVVMLHGAGGEARNSIRTFMEQADVHGLVLLALDSRERTWDVIVGGFGADVVFMDRALEQVFGGVVIDPDRVAVQGFSDGASYALSLGLANGDLFEAIVAFSPGFSAGEQPVGRPRVFVSHGRRDPVLPIARTSRRVVPRLERQDIDVRYEEFAGGHNVPPQILAAALDWLLEGWDITARERRASR